MGCNPNIFVDYRKEQNASGLLNIAVMLFVFAWALFMCFDHFVLDIVGILGVLVTSPEEQQNTLLGKISSTINTQNLAYRSLFVADNSSSSTDYSYSEEIPLPDSNVSGIYWVLAYVLLGTLAAIPVFLGNSTAYTSKFIRPLRLAISLVFVAMYMYAIFAHVLPIFSFKPLINDKFYVFQKIQATVLLFLATLILFLYILLLVAIFTPYADGMMYFRINRSYNLVKRLLVHNVKRSAYLRQVRTQSTITIEQIEIASTCQEKASLELSRLIAKARKSFMGKPRHHSNFEQFFDMFFPTRLFITTLVSAYCLLFMGFVAVSNIERFVYLFLLIFGQLFPSNVVELIFTITSYACFAGLIPTFIVWGTYLLTFFNYRDQLFKIRQGKYEFEKEKFSILPAYQLTGIQLWLGLVSYFILLIGVVGITVAVVVFVLLKKLEWAGVTLLKAVLAIIVTLVGDYIVSLILRCCFLQGGRIKNAQIYSCWDYSASYLYLMIALKAVLSRIKSAVINIVFYFPRVDISIAPYHKRHQDQAYCAFISTLLMDHEHTNPVLLVFLDMLTKTSKGLATQVVDPQEYNELQAKEPLLSKQASYMSLRNDGPKQRVVIRWQLARMLIQNPSLCKYRKKMLRARDNNYDMYI